MGAQERVAGLEATRLGAMLAGDVAILGALLADEFIMVHSSAMIESKSDYLGRLADGSVRYLTLSSDLIDHRSMSGVAIAISNLDAHVSTARGELRLSTVSTAVWRAYGAEWKCVLVHGTPR